jgi:hypothetical protein
MMAQPSILKVTIRSLADADRTLWEPLWKGYLDFYEKIVPGEVTEFTLARLWQVLWVVLVLVGVVLWKMIATGGSTKADAEPSYSEFMDSVAKGM